MWRTAARPLRAPRPPTVPLTIDVQIAGGPMGDFLERDVHASLVDRSGRVSTWKVASGKPAMVPDGELVLDVWSVLHSDTIVCPTGATGMGPDCYQRTMGPAATCSGTGRLVAGEAARFRYKVLPEERCQLRPRNGS